MVSKALYILIIPVAHFRYLCTILTFYEPIKISQGHTLTHVLVSKIEHTEPKLSLILKITKFFSALLSEARKFSEARKMSVTSKMSKASKMSEAS